MESENIIFSVERIKELTNSIDAIQGKSNLINKLYLIYKEALKNLLKKPNLMENDRIKFFNDLDNLLEAIYSKLSKNSEFYLENWLLFKDLLLSQHILTIKNILTEKNFSQESLKKVGISLIKKKRVSSFLEKISFIFSLDIDFWESIVNALNNNPDFLKTLNKIKIFYQNEMERLLNIELNKIPKNIDYKIINEFKKEFKKKNISFKEFMITSKSKFPKKKFAREKITLETKKKKNEFDRLKEKQDTRFKSYDKLFTLSEDEFQRLKRKKKRKKLDSSSKLEKKEHASPDKKKEIDKKKESTQTPKQDIFSREIKENIEDDIDPIEVIKKRKQKKEEEFEKYLNKIQKKTKRGSD